MAKRIRKSNIHVRQDPDPDPGFECSDPSFAYLDPVLTIPRYDTMRMRLYGNKMISREGRSYENEHLWAKVMVYGLGVRRRRPSLNLAKVSQNPD